MARRYIGIDYEGETLRVAVVSAEKGTTEMTSLLKTVCDDPAEIPEKLKALLGDSLITDLYVTALDAKNGFVRRLQFPFNDRKKIAAALDLELTSQIPTTDERLVTDFLSPEELDEGTEVVAAAVESGRLRSLIETFDAASLPLQIVDLYPFALLPLCRGEARDLLLASVGHTETTITLVLKGRYIDHRILPKGEDDLATVDFLKREGALLVRAHRSPSLPLSFFGSRVTADFLALCEEKGLAGEVIDFSHGGSRIDAEFLPAAALAAGASGRGPYRGFNFRKGAFALRSEWTKMRRSLSAMALLLLLSIFLTTAAAVIDYTSKKREADTIQGEMLSLYRDLFPEVRVIVDVPLQMESSLKELRERASYFGTGRRDFPQVVLTELSRIPEDVVLEVRDLSLSEEKLTLRGTTPSFELLNRISEALQNSPVFGDVQVSEAKMSLDGLRVEFRIDALCDERSVL